MFLPCRFGKPLLKSQKGSIDSRLGPEALSRHLLRVNSVTVMPLSTNVAAHVRTLPFSHADPANRFIAATGFQLGYSLATVDQALRKLAWLKMLPESVASRNQRPNLRHNLIDCKSRRLYQLCVRCDCKRTVLAINISMVAVLDLLANCLERLFGAFGLQF